MPPLVFSKVSWFANKEIEMCSLYNTHKDLKMRVKWAHSNGCCKIPFHESEERRIFKAIFDALEFFCWEVLKYCSLKKRVILKCKPVSCESVSCESVSCVFMSRNSESCEPNNFQIVNCESSSLRVVSYNLTKP